MDAVDGPCLATVIPVYNEAEHIEACLMSLLHQTFPSSKHMILVVDGHSSDNTVELVNNIIQRHQGAEWPQVQLLANPERSVAHARNLAL
ncbi:MAG TPA: glycosyltransferase, partial [Candidatus Poseidoniales archaeon]